MVRPFGHAILSETNGLSCVPSIKDFAIIGFMPQSDQYISLETMTVNPIIIYFDINIKDNFSSTFFSFHVSGMCKF